MNWGVHVTCAAVCMQDEYMQLQSIGERVINFEAAYRLYANLAKPGFDEQNMQSTLP